MLTLSDSSALSGILTLDFFANLIKSSSGISSIPFFFNKLSSCLEADGLLVVSFFVEVLFIEVFLVVANFKKFVLKPLN